jgi:hypothetical protein
VWLLLNHYIVHIAKRLVIFAPNFAEKSPFLSAAWLAALCPLCRLPFKWVQWWPPQPMARTACCLSTNEFFSGNRAVVFVEMACASEVRLARATTVLSLWLMTSTTHLMTLVT